MYSLLASAGLSMLLDNDSVQDSTYKFASTAAAIGAGVVTRKVLSSAWESATGEAPPNDPADPSVSWQQALTWAAAAGVGVGVGRVVGRKLAANALSKSFNKDEEALAS